MIDKIVDEMLKEISDLKASILADIEDIKQGKHEKLLDRNDEKHSLIEMILAKKQDLNNQIVTMLQNNQDVNQYKEKIDYLENELKDLYKLNRRLAAIVLPIQKMYKEIVDELNASNGGNLFDVKA